MSDRLLNALNKWWEAAVASIYRIEDGARPDSRMLDADIIVDECDRLGLAIDVTPIAEYTDMVHARTARVICQCGGVSFDGVCERCSDVTRSPLWAELPEMQRTLGRARIAYNRLLRYCERTSEPPAPPPPPKPRLVLADDHALLDGRPIPTSSKKLDLLRLLLGADGEYVNLSANSFRTRDVEGLPTELRDLVESQPGAGSRIPRDRLYP